jgi:hypothetical protein
MTREVSAGRGRCFAGCGSEVQRGARSLCAVTRQETLVHTGAMVPCRLRLGFLTAVSTRSLYSHSSPNLRSRKRVGAVSDARAVFDATITESL